MTRPVPFFLCHTHSFTFGPYTCISSPDATPASSLFTLKQIYVTTEGTDQGLNFVLHSAVFSFCLCLCNKTYRCQTSDYYVTLCSFSLDDMLVLVYFQLERGVSAPEAKVRLFGTQLRSSTISEYMFMGHGNLQTINNLIRGTISHECKSSQARQSLWLDANT